VDPLRRGFDVDEPLTGLGLAPQSDRALQESSLLRRSIFLDQLLDAGTPFGRFGQIDCHRTLSLARTITAALSRIAQPGGCQRVILDAFRYDGGRTSER
jgi:hypothetical protein